MASLQDPEETDTTERDTDSLCPKKERHCQVDAEKVVAKYTVITGNDQTYKVTSWLRCFPAIVLFEPVILQSTLWSFFYS